jgi:hypothetical protein
VDPSLAKVSHPGMTSITSTMKVDELFWLSKNSVTLDRHWILDDLSFVQVILARSLEKNLRSRQTGEIVATLAMKRHSA